MKTSRWGVATALVLCVSAARAQEPAGAEEEPETRNEIGVFVGALSNLETDDTGPGAGLDYTRELSQEVGIGALAEWANAGEREAMFGLTLDWKPGANVKLVLGPAVVLTREDEESRSAAFAMRTGIGRTLEVNQIPLMPTLYVDFVNAEAGLEVHLAYGLTIEIPF